jgi:hypothetical protein
MHSKEIRSKNMAAIKGKNTKPEMQVRKFLLGLATGTGYTKKSLNQVCKRDLHRNRHNRYMAGEGEFPRIDFKKLIDKALLFRNRNYSINFFGFRKTDNGF